MSLVYQPVQVPLVAGLDTKDDVRFSSPPKLDIAKDLQMEEIGGVQTRPPMAAMATAVFGGGSLANCRRLATVNGELCVFTSTGFYSLNSDLSSWANRGEHLAVSTDHAQRFATNGDQTICDRAELNGTVVYTWSEGTQLVWMAALSSATGAVIMAPTSVAGRQGRVVALSTKILFFLYQVAGGLTVRAIDPANPATGFGGAATTVDGSMTSTFDVIRVPGVDQAAGACEAGGASYTAFTVTAGLVVSSSSKGRAATGGGIAVAMRPPSGAQMHVFRTVTAGTLVRGDVLTTATLSDVTIDQAIGTYTGTLNRITACFRSVQTAGQYVCAVFWNAGYTAIPSIAFDCKTNTVDGAGTIGSQSTFVPGLFIASRAFDRSGSVYIAMLFGFANQAEPSPTVEVRINNQYLLYREDRTLHGKSVATVAGDAVLSGQSVLPGVETPDGLTYQWAANLKRSAVLTVTGGLGIGGSQLFGARSLADISWTFDSDAARRSAQIGRTLYITGSEVIQYDGVRLVETGFNVFQYACSLGDGGAATGSVAAGSYGVKSTYSYTNSQGEFERSTTGALGTVSIAAGTSSLTSAGAGHIIGPLYTTRKTATAPSVEVWRTTVNPTVDSPYYLTTSLDPTITSNPNRYLSNSTAGIATFVDALADSSLTSHVANPENGGVLESLAPPSATLIAASDTRLMLASVAGDPDRVWPSRERNDGEIASFNDALPVEVPSVGGTTTALWFQDGTLYVGRETAIYALPGSGLDNLGQGQNFGPPQEVSLDVGPSSQEAQAQTPVGTVFKSRKGWYLMDRGRNLRYIGGPVSAFDADTVKAVTVVSNRHQVRVLTDQRMLVWDYRGAVDANTPEAAGNWFEWSITGGLDACMWNGSYVYLTSTGPRIEQTAYTGLTYGIDVEPSWLKMRDLQGYGKVGALLVLGEYRSDFLLRVRLARDYQYDGAGNVVYYDDKAWAPTQTTVGSAFQVRHTPSASFGNCEAIKYRLTAVADGARATLGMLSMSPQFTTSGTPWASIWRAARVSGGATAYGEMGNRLTMTVAFGPGTGATTLLPVPFVFAFENGMVIVNDHYTWSTTANRWIEAVNNIGVLITGPVSVGDAEASIAAATTLATLLTPDPSPGVIAYDTMLALGPCSGAFSGGTYSSPSGEAMKLTGVALEVGIDPRTFKRLAAGQKQ